MKASATLVLLLHISHRLYALLEHMSQIAMFIYYRIGMHIEKQTWFYPDTCYQVYRITMNGMQFQNKDRIILTLFGVDPGHLFLVAVNRQSRGTKFISGLFFLTTIRNNPLSCIPYLPFKTYANELQQIRFGSRRLNLWYYQAYPAALQKSVTLVLDTKHTEHVKILTPQRTPKT
jgi:hypothetical protein